MAPRVPLPSVAVFHRTSVPSGFTRLPGSGRASRFAERRDGGCPPRCRSSRPPTRRVRRRRPSRCPMGIPNGSVRPLRRDELEIGTVLESQDAMCVPPVACGPPYTAGRPASANALSIGARAEPHRVAWSTFRCTGEAPEAIAATATSSRAGKAQTRGGEEPSSQAHRWRFSHWNEAGVRGRTGFKIGATCSGSMHGSGAAVTPVPRPARRPRG